MISVYLEAGNFTPKEDARSLAHVIDSTRSNIGLLRSIPTDALLLLLDKAGAACMSDPILREADGVTYLVLWLKRKNLDGMIRDSFQHPGVMDGFVEIRDRTFLHAAPRGLVCHWIAGNVPTLAVFSLVQSILCRNANILRIPSASVPLVLRFLSRLSETSVVHEGRTYSGKDVLAAVSVVYFDKGDAAANAELSLAADAKVIWGGKDAVKAIKAYPEQEHCEDVIFGPKYSFGVLDRGFLEGDGLEGLLTSLVMDIVAFDQSACSSPQVLFIEKNSRLSVRQFAQMLAKGFREISARYPKREMLEYTVTKIINARSTYLLDERKDLVAPEKPDWTILIDDELVLNEAVQSRTIFVKEVPDLADVAALITPKIQTVGIAIKDDDRAIALCRLFASCGVARCVRFGTMNHYEFPWDGSFVMGRLVRFVIVRR